MEPAKQSAIPSQAISLPAESYGKQIPPFHFSFVKKSRIFLMPLFFALVFPAASVPNFLNAAEAEQEVRLFLKNLPQDLSRKQIAAMQKAKQGNSAPLEAIRLARPDTPPPAGVRIRNTTLNGVPVRIYHPEKAPEKPLKTVLYLHGGGWVIGNLKTCSRFCGELCAAEKVIVIAVDYRLAPEHPYPAALEDVMRVLQAARSPLPDLPDDIKNDPERIFLAGDSAGGNLAAAAALKEYDQTGKTPAGVLLFYPVTDLSDRNSLSRQRYGKGYALDADLMDAFLDCYLPAGKQTHEIRYLSPLKTDLSSFPPALIVTSEYDILHDQGCAFAEALKQKKRRVIHHDYKGAVHIFITVPGMDSFFRRAVHDAASFLREFKS